MLVGGDQVVDGEEPVGLQEGHIARPVHPEKHCAHWSLLGRKSFHINCREMVYSLRRNHDISGAIFTKLAGKWLNNG